MEANHGRQLLAYFLGRLSCRPEAGQESCRLVLELVLVKGGRKERLVRRSPSRMRVYVVVQPKSSFATSGDVGVEVVGPSTVGLATARKITPRNGPPTEKLHHRFPTSRNGHNTSMRV